MLQPPAPWDRFFLRSGIWKTLPYFTSPSNDLQDLATELSSPLDFISPPERKVKRVQEMFSILDKGSIFPFTVCILRAKPELSMTALRNMLTLMNLMG